MTLRDISTSLSPFLEDSAHVPSVGRFVGCLLGCAIGDAVGAPAERRPSTFAREYASRLERFDFETSEHHGGAKFGEYTDDTQLTRELAISLVEHRGFDPASFARRLAEAFEQHRIVGGGRSTAAAAKRLHDGVPWEDAGTPPPLAGNGAAMRVAPLGLFYWNNLVGLVEAARDQAIITHRAEASVAGSVAIAVATAMCLNASKSTSHPAERGWWAWLARFLSLADHASLAEDVQLLVERVFAGRRTHGRLAGDLAEREDVFQWLNAEDDASWDGISPWARTTVLWSLYCLLAHPTNYWAAIRLAIWPGGDVDTTAAIAGAMVGAHVGIDRFPSEVVEKMRLELGDARTPGWGWDGLEGLARQLHETATQPSEE